MTRLTQVIAAALLLSCTESGFAAPMARDADTIFINGTILTLDAEGHVAEAVAVKEDRIVAVGTSDEIRSLAGPGATIRNLRRRVMVPGFYAPHDHFPGNGTLALFKVNLNSPPMGPIRDMKDLIRALKRKARETPEGTWVVGSRYDDTLMKEGRHPTRHDLDKVSTKHPIWIGHTSGHLGVANSLALKKAGITRDTKQPTGAVIQKDPETGEPNGIFEECSWLVSRKIPARTLEQNLQAMEWAVKEYLRQGVTTNVIAGGGKESVTRLKAAFDRGILRLRVISMTYPRWAESARNVVKGVDPSRLKVGAIKIVQDGATQGFTSYLTKPYHTPFKGDPSYRGYPRRSREALTKMVKQLHRAGYQIAIHGNGDAAIDDILHAFAEAQKDFPRSDARHRIEHCQLVRQDQLDTNKKLDITPSFFAGHVYYWGDRHLRLFTGPERGAGIVPFKSALARGIRFTLHDDTPVTSVRPIQLVWVAVNRLTRSGTVLGAGERITPEQALRAVTIDAAWQCFEEKTKGSIEKGKLADLVILDRNPLTIEPVRIRDIRVLETIVGGKTAYLK